MQYLHMRVKNKLEIFANIFNLECPIHNPTWSPSKLLFSTQASLCPIHMMSSNSQEHWIQQRLWDWILFQLFNEEQHSEPALPLVKQIHCISNHAIWLTRWKIAQIFLFTKSGTNSIESLSALFVHS